MVESVTHWSGGKRTAPFNAKGEGLRLSTAEELALHLVCPQCYSSLRCEKAERLRCRRKSCSLGVPIVGGVPSFLDAIGAETDGNLETDFFPHPRRRGPISKNVAEAMREDVARELQELGRSRGAQLDVLDIGCGTKLSGARGAQQYSMLEANCGTYFGIDPSWGVLSALCEDPTYLHSFPKAFVARAAGEKLPFAESSMDAVLMESVLDHCVDPRSVVADAKRVLRPGGKVFIRLGHREGWVFKTMRVVRPKEMRRRDEEDHHLRFSRVDIIELLHESGYKEIDCRERGYVALPPEGRVLEGILYTLGKGAVLGEERFRRWLAGLDGWASEKLPGLGSRFLVVATEPGEDGTVRSDGKRRTAEAPGAWES